MGRLSLTANPLVAVKAYPSSAYSLTPHAQESLGRGALNGLILPLSTSLFHILFPGCPKCYRALLYQCPPADPFSGSVFPVFLWDFDCVKVSPQLILVAFSTGAPGMFVRAQFSIKHGQSRVLHARQVACPA